MRIALRVQQLQGFALVGLPDVLAQDADPMRTRNLLGRDDRRGSRVLGEVASDHVGDGGSDVDVRGETICAPTPSPSGSRKRESSPPR